MLNPEGAVSLPATRPQIVSAQGEHTLELREVLRIVLERWRIILAAAVLGLLAGMVVTAMTTPRYRAYAMLQYDPSANESIEQSRGLSFRPTVANQEMVATQLGLLRSETLARRVTEELNLADAPGYGAGTGTREDRVKRATAVLLAGTDSDSLRDSLLLRISNSSANPRLAQRITSALAQNFIALSLERKYNASSYARQFLSNELGKTKAALEESERAVNDYAISSGLFRTPAQVVDGKTTDGAALSVNDLAAMEAALNQARVQRINAENAWRSGAIDKPAENAPMIATLEQQRATLRADYAEGARLFKPEYPKMQELAAHIARLDTDILAERGRSTGQQRAQLGAAYHAALKTEQDLTARVMGVKGQVQGDRGRSIRYNILQRDVDTNRTLYDALLSRFKEVGVAGGIGKSTIALVDDAQLPSAPYRPNGIINALIGVLLGIGLGLVAAFMVHLLFDTMADAADVRAKLHQRVLGVIPLEGNAEAMSEALSDPKSEVAEAYYAMLTALKFARPEGPPRSVFVTSSRPGEGKSTSAYAIAVSSARLGRKVLLIDADLRRPTFRIDDRAPGFAHLLASEDALVNHIRPTGLANLSLLPVGPFSGSAAELLSSMRLPAIIAEATRLADLVVLDGPPLLGLTDAPLLAAAAEGTVIVVESRKTRTSHAAELARRVIEANGELLGVILTKVARGGMGYGYYHDYHYDYQGLSERSTGSQARFNPGGTLTPSGGV